MFLRVQFLLFFVATVPGNLPNVKAFHAQNIAGLAANCNGRHSVQGRGLKPSRVKEPAGAKTVIMVSSGG